MAKRFFTADFHFGMKLLLDEKIMKDAVRPFKTIDKMNSSFIRNCNERAKVYTKEIPVLDKNGNQKVAYECKLDDFGNFIVDPDTMKPIIEKRLMFRKEIIGKDLIIHVGDLACFKSDREFSGLDVNPQEFIQKINATFINIKGNHDLNNKVKSACTCMQTSLGKRFPNVTIGHYPSYDIRAKDMFREGWIHICGHVHGAWKHCVDVTNNVLNINVGVDAWNYSIISEDELVQYISEVLKMSKDQLNKVKIVGNKIVRVK